MRRIGVADTMFSRGDMGAVAVRTIKASGKPVEIVRYTVPGIKDLPVACKKLFFDHGCDIVIATGMVGGKPVDKQCGHEASLGIQSVQISASRHILEVFVHEDESAGDDVRLAEIMADRTEKHAQNALDLLFNPASLTLRAGTGQRQGGPNASRVRL
ncbi:riboflavin synthase [Candidatus Micrarchaeota archaeon CG1_02_55_22]|nr:MAG: riboflavin synthase [Candidatus Micrarchaeota archaeon CG1_02_55_22]